MRILPQFVSPLCSLSPSFPLLPPSAAYTARGKRLALPAPKPMLMLSAPQIAGYLPAPLAIVRPVRSVPQPARQVVSAEIVNTEVLFARNSDAYWDEFDRRHGFRSEEEMDAELDALVPNWRRILGDDDDDACDDAFWGKVL